jgi:hypothetical protein
MMPTRDGLPRNAAAVATTSHMKTSVTRRRTPRRLARMRASLRGACFTIGLLAPRAGRAGCSMQGTRKSAATERAMNAHPHTQDCVQCTSQGFTFIRVVVRRPRN